jgi:hypothetical protein
VRLPVLIPLLREQPCITGTSHHHGEFITHDFSTHRSGGLRYGESIIKRQARWVRAKVDLSRTWLNVEDPDPRSLGKIIINRTNRWPGFLFPWRSLVGFFGEDLLFVGLKEEHEEFCKRYGKVAYQPTQSLLEVAQLIAGAATFIGNQSCPLAIAEGLQKRTIVEVCCFAPDCLNIRPGNTHVIDGKLEFSALGKRFSSNGEGTIQQVEEELIERAKQVYETLK